MPGKKVTFVKTKEVKKGKFKGLQKGVKSKKMSEKRAQKKQAKGKGFISKAYGSNPIEMSPYKMGHSPAEMGHSPAEMGHKDSAMKMGHSPAEMGHSPAEMETKKQEKYNLLHDNPVAKHASWLSKHATQSRMGSPLKGHCMNK